MPTSTTSKWGLHREEPAALLRVRTGPECPEGNWRELTRDSNLNCGTAREREKKLTGQNTLWAPSQNKRRTERSQRRASRLRTSAFPTGGRRQGGGERGKLTPRDGTPTKLQTGSVSNQRLPEILDG